MPTPKIAKAPTFDGAEITAFFKMINKMFATHDITKDQKKKQWVLNYLLPLIT